MRSIEVFMVRFLCIVLSLFLAACSQSQTTLNQTARLSINADPTMLDPRKARDLDSVNLVHMLFEGLTRTSQTGSTEFAIADRVEIDEAGLRYIFHLRKSYWSNGDPLTASDFSTSWKTILDPTYASDIAYHLYPIKNARKAKIGEVNLEEVGVKALDDRTLLVELEQPVPYFLELLSMTAFFPVPTQIVSKTMEWGLVPETRVSNGPFYLEDWKHAEKLTLAKNLRYYEAELVKLSTLDFYIAPPDTALQMYEEGKLDWTGSPFSRIPIDAIRSLKNERRLQISPFLGTSFFRINIASAIGGRENPLADREARHLLASSIDREGIINHVLQGGQKAARSLVPPEMGLYHNEPCSWIFCGHHSDPSSNDPSSARLQEYQPPHDRSNLGHSESGLKSKSMPDRGIQTGRASSRSKCRRFVRCANHNQLLQFRETPASLKPYKDSGRVDWGSKCVWKPWSLKPIFNGSPRRNIRLP